MQVFFFSFLLFVLPLIVLPFGVSYFETPKIILAEILIEILFIFFIFGKIDLKKNINKVPYYLLVGIFLLTLLDLVLFRTSISLFGNVFRLQGIFVLWHLLIFSFISSQFDFKTVPKYIPSIAFGLLVFGGFSFGTNQAGRAVGTIGEPNALSATVLFIWPFVYFLSLNKPTINKMLKILLLVLVSSLIFLTGSRSGLIGFSIQLIFISLLKYFKLSFKKASIIAFLLILTSLSLPFFERGGIYENRKDVWVTAFFTGLRNPVLGTGFGNIEKDLPETARQISNNSRFQYVDSSHNVLLDWWVQGGLVGLSIFCLLIFFSFTNFLKNSKIPETTLFLGVFSAMLFNPASIVTLVAFWFLVGQGLRVER